MGATAPGGEHSPNQRCARNAGKTFPARKDLQSATEFLSIRHGSLRRSFSKDWSEAVTTERLAFRGAGRSVFPARRLLYHGATQPLTPGRVGPTRKGRRRFPHLATAAGSSDACLPRVLLLPRPPTYSPLHQPPAPPAGGFFFAPRLRTTKSRVLIGRACRWVVTCGMLSFRLLIHGEFAHG